MLILLKFAFGVFIRVWQEGVPQVHGLANGAKYNGWMQSKGVVDSTTFVVESFTTTSEFDGMIGS